jgi:hypothetical protein
MARAQQNLEWFRPMWRRVAIVGFCVAWCLVEWFVTRDQYFSWITTALVAYAVWTFFIAFDRNAGPPSGPTPPAETPPQS